jgi:CheY-like chemotaxis protein
MSLILNAVDAMPQGGTLALRTQAEGGLAALEVSDTGVGMTEEIRRRCLEPFFSTKGAGASGMGLTVVDSIVRRHGGTIDIESKPDAGTVVAICLPVKPAAPPKIEDGIEALKQMAGLRVLVVDDESWSRLAVTKLLVTDGHMVETAASGREGLEKFRDGVFDLVVTDRAMPDMSGEELAETVKRHREPRPVILVTGFADTTDKGWKSVKCVDAVVNKPVKPEDLRKAILTVILRQ